MSLLYNRNEGSGQQPILSDDKLSVYCTQLNCLFDFDLGSHVDDVFCDKCTRYPTCVIRYHNIEKYPWLYELQCSNTKCQKIWYLCRKCSPKNFRSSSCKPTRVNHKNNRINLILEEHHNTHHASGHINDKDFDASQDNDIDFLDVSEDNSGEISVQPQRALRTVDNSIETQEHLSTQVGETRSFINSLFDEQNLKGKEYFLHEFKEKNSGLLSVIAFSLADCQDPFSITKEDAVLHLMFTRQFLRATRDERIHNVDILSRLNKRYQKDIEVINAKHETQVESLTEYISYLESQLSSRRLFMGDEEDNRYSSPSEVNLEPVLQRPRTTRRLAIPTSPNDCRKYLEGKNCVLSKIPSPNVNVLNDGYAYVSVKEVISILLAMGISTPKNTPSMNLQSSRSYFNKPAFVELMREHGIPENEYTSCLLISEWTDGVETSSAKSNRGSMKATTLTIEGAERTNNHTFVVASGKSKSDQNQYRAMLYQELKELMQPNLYYDGITQSVLQYRLVHYLTVADRPEISEATGVGAHNALYCSVPSTCFPVVVAPPHPSRIVHVKTPRFFASCEVCYEERLAKYPAMHEGAKSSVECDQCDDWDPHQVKWEVMSPNFPLSMIPESGYHSTKTLTFDMMRDACSTAFVKCLSGEWSDKQFTEYLKVFQFSSVLLKQLIKKMSEEGVHEFDDSYLPAKMRSNSTIELYRHLPGIMHLIFLGLAKTMLRLLQDLMKTARNYSPFHDAGNAYLKKLRSLSLEFCKAWNFGSMKTPHGPWVAENCLGYVRVMKGLYSLMSTILPDTDPNQEKIRMAHKCIWSFVAFVSRVMQDEHTPTLIDETECILKLFLSEFEMLDDFVRKPKAKPTVEKTGNVMYLLRIPQLMRDFGPLREFWEGSVRGEGIFRFLKPLIRRGIHNPGACRALLVKYFSDKFITWILEKANSLPEDDDDDEDDETVGGDRDTESDYLRLTKRYCDVNTHQSKSKLQERLDDNLPISLVESDNKLYAKYKVDKKTTKLVRVVIQQESATHLNGSDVFNLILVDEEVDDIQISACQPCIACPIYVNDEDGVTQCFYYVVSSLWKEMISNGNWVLPTLFFEEDMMI